MKAPSVAPITVTQVFAEIAGAAGLVAALGAPSSADEAALSVDWRAVIGVSS